MWRDLWQSFDLRWRGWQCCGEHLPSNAALHSAFTRTCSEEGGGEHLVAICGRTRKRSALSSGSYCAEQRDSADTWWMLVLGIPWRYSCSSFFLPSLDKYHLVAVSCKSAQAVFPFAQITCSVIEVDEWVGAQRDRSRQWSVTAE